MGLEVEEAGCFESFGYGESDGMLVGRGSCEEGAKVDQLQQTSISRGSKQTGDGAYRYLQIILVHRGRRRLKVLGRVRGHCMYGARGSKI
jgi:hypothetical protein